jgi:hypothetical protein
VLNRPNTRLAGAKNGCFEKQSRSVRDTSTGRHLGLKDSGVVEPGVGDNGQRQSEASAQTNTKRETVVVLPTRSQDERAGDKPSDSSGNNYTELHVKV